MDTTGTVTPLSTALAALSNMIATGGILEAGKIHLYTNNLQPSPQTQLTDFVEADYVGYLAVAWGAWGAPYIGIDGLAHATAPGIQFQPTDGTTPNTVYGFYATNTAGTALIFSALFVQPVDLLDATYAVIVEPDVIYGR
jgi:hypothetical protein